MAIDTRISAPPMVGVPALTRWVCGPSSRTAWPIFIAVRRRIMAGPTMNEIVKRRQRRQHRAQRDVVEHVEGADVLRQPLSQPDATLAVCTSKLFTTRSICMKREPLTSTVTSGASRFSRSASNSSMRSKCSAPAPNAAPAARLRSPSAQQTDSPAPLRAAANFRVHCRGIRHPVRPCRPAPEFSCPAWPPAPRWRRAPNPGLAL